MNRNLYMNQIGYKAKAAAKYLSSLNLEKRNLVLRQFAKNIKSNSKAILKVNKKDILKAKKNKSKMIDRLFLNEKKNRRNNKIN